MGIDFTRCACPTLSSARLRTLTMASKDAETSEGTKRLATLRKRKQGEGDNENAKRPCLVTVVLLRSFCHVCSSNTAAANKLSQFHARRPQKIELAPHCKETSSHFTASTQGDGWSSTWHCPSCACTRPYLRIRISSIIPIPS